MYAATNNYLVMVTPSHAPAIVDKKLRMDDLDRMLNVKYVTRNQALFKKYQVGYLIVQGAAIDNFLNYPEILTLVYSFNDQNHTIIFKVNQD